MLCPQADGSFAKTAQCEPLGSVSDVSFVSVTGSDDSRGKEKSTAEAFWDRRELRKKVQDWRKALQGRQTEKKSRGGETVYVIDCNGGIRSGSGTEHGRGSARAVTG